MTQTSLNATSGTAPAADYAGLARQIRAAGLMKRRNDFYIVLIGTVIAAHVAAVAVMVTARDSWWLLLLAPAYAVVTTQTTFIGHDAAHRQIAAGARNSAWLGFFHGNLLSGLSYGWWVAKHNAHHAHPNDLEHDPDVAVGAFVFDHEQATQRRGAAGWLTRHQAGLFFPILLLEAFNLHVASVLAVLRPGMRHRKTEAVLLAVHFAAYTTLLVTTMTWSQGLLFLAIHQGLFGLYLGCSFAPSHKGMPALSAEEASDRVRRQVLTSRNIRGGPFTSLVYGGLDLQIEHHLFPSMPRPNLRRAQPIVERFCRDNEISYMQASVLESYGLGLRHMQRVGESVGRPSSAEQGASTSQNGRTGESAS